MSAKRTIILTHEEIERKMQRMAWEIYENNHLAEQLVLLGIADNGSHIANALGKILAGISKIKIETGLINLDKSKGFDSEVTLECSVDLKDKIIIIVDDVLNSGKTMLACMMPVINKKPAKIQTAV